MKEKTVEKVWEVTKKVTSYIAEDGTEFEGENAQIKCMIYEDELKLNEYWKKYSVKKTYVPDFIYPEAVYGISFLFPKDGVEFEVAELLRIYMNYNLIFNEDKIEIGQVFDLENVFSDDMNFTRPLSLERGKRYLFYFVWKDNIDNWDYYFKELVSEEKARNSLKEEIREFEKMFDTEWNNENI